MNNSVQYVLVCYALFLLGRNATASEGPGEDHPPALSPTESAKRFKVADGLEIGLVVAEPEVTQPLSISFDDRGRMWVLQYRQYPNPNGLKPVQMDNWLRTKYDKIPDPPPKGPRGQDRISIYEDANGDGRADSVIHFLSDLNLASGMALGHGGVFVIQPPYLLFYADRNHDDVPDGPPDVLLKGFGMEDAHAFANSLTWGPDSWLYGAQGSTSTANIRGIGFQQGVWRYHPQTKQFELFAEGGGNSWGVDFDRYGNLFAAGNTVEPLVHHVQGAYYVKGFGKHGPLHNPHAYGYFQPVLHHGYVGDSLTGGAVLYQGGAFPACFNDACIAPNTRHSACRWSTVESRTSTFATRAAGDFVVSEDVWFRPVDITVGPDGAVYIADWYDYNISHSSPLNRSEWYQPSRLDGRVWRVAPPKIAPLRAGSFDLSKKPSNELVQLLSHRNDWYARQARRILTERRDRTVVSTLTAMALESHDQRLALQSLWSIYGIDGLEGGLAAKLLNSPHEYVRAWTVRLLGDERMIPPTLINEVVRLARNDKSVIVRSQLACTAKRLPADQGMSIVEQQVLHDEDIDDVHMPLLLWWAIEDKAISDTNRVLRLLETSDNWRRPLVERIIVERLARRLAAEGTDAAYGGCARLLGMAANKSDRDRVIYGMLQALSGRKLETVPPPLKSKFSELFLIDSANAKVIELALRMNVAEASNKAARLITDRAAIADDRIAVVKSLGETRSTESIHALLSLLGELETEIVHVATLSALGYFNDEKVADVVLSQFSRLSPASQARAIELLCSRPQSAIKLIESIDNKAIPDTAFYLYKVRKMREWNDDRLVNLIAKRWGRVQTTTPLEMQGRIAAVQQLLYRGKGDTTRGREQFKKVCANCHKLHGQGETIGPDLTGAERKNRELLVRNVVHPSDSIREQYLTHVATTSDGRVMTGLLAESSADTITLLDAKNNRTVINRADLDELQESPVSLMPEKLLDTMNEQQIWDLFIYLQMDPGQK